MDFRALLKQAAANQAVTEKQFERDKVKEQESKAQEKLQKESEKKKSAIKLKQYEKEVVKSRLTYQGLLSSSGQPLSEKARKELNKVSSPSKPSVTSTKSVSNHTNKSRLSTPASKSKSTSPCSDTSHKGSHPVSKPVPKTPKSQTPPPRLKDSKTKTSAPVNFKDLLRLAQQNSKKDNTSTETSITKPPLQIKTDKGPAVGIGKALLNRQRKEEKKEATASPVTSKTSQQETDNRTKGLSTSYKKTIEQQQDKEPNAMTKKPNSSLIDKPESKTLANGRFNIKDLPYPEILQRARPTGSCVPRGGQPARGSGSKTMCLKPSQAMKSKSFYGGSVPTSARLITDGKSSSSSSYRNGPMYYKSVWVDEMRDYIQNNKMDYMYEDDDELDDFVVDDGEEMDDYSSTIRSIFGYDRSQYQLREEDDSLMESSYTQQQFEELRSERIGRMEDAEDMRNEQEMLARKRKKESKGETSNKKLKF